MCATAGYSKTTSTQRQISLDTAADLREIISLDSDDDDDDDVQILTPGGNSAIAGLRNGSAATASSNGVGGNQRPQQQQSHHNDKGERIILKIRSNGERTDDVPIHMVRAWTLKVCVRYVLTRLLVRG